MTFPADRPPASSPRARLRASDPLLDGLAVVILLFACFAPLVTTLASLPDVTGAEGGLSAGAWLIVILRTSRVSIADVLLAALLVWTGLSSAYNDVPLIAALLMFSLVASPFVFLRLLLVVSNAGFKRVRGVLVGVVLAQFMMFAYQYATRVSVDDLTGTLVGTYWGAHVAGFFVLLGAAIFSMSRPRQLSSVLVILLAVAAAYVADAKIGLVYFLVVTGTYAVFGKKKISQGLRPSARLALAGIAVLAIWAIFTGALGGIALKAYAERSITTGGGKIAVTEILADPGSVFWDRENFMLGAGPGQTVSRTAGLTVDQDGAGAPAARLGIPPSEYYLTFERIAAGYGFIGTSSATKAASSVLGILGDLGLVGLLMYAGLFLWVCLHFARTLGWRSWAVVAWVTLLLPGALGEWLEFPAACIFLAAALEYLRRQSETSNASANPGLTPLLQ